MSKYLFIVESPNKCPKIRSYLGSDYNVMATVGHIKQIPKKGMNIDTKNGFEPVYEISSDKKEIVKKIKLAAKDCEKIFLASDNDREGENISYSVYTELDEKSKKKCVRIVFEEISKKAIEKAISDGGVINMDRVNAQKARQVLDRLIGYKISPMLWFTVGRGTSAGRVQSIALKLVGEKEIEIQNFKPQDFWYIDALLKCKEGEFWAKVVTKDKDNRYLDEKLSQDDFEKLKKASYKIGSIEKKERIVNAYAPFDTASLQSGCGSLFGWSVKKTASLSQSLYEQGKVTYIRTDSYNISQDALNEVRELIKKSSSSEYLPSKPNIYHQKAKASSQEAHECIRPVKILDSGDDIDNSDEKKLYKLIRDRFIACQITPMVVDTLVYDVDASTKHKLVAKGQTIKFDGWSKFYKYSNTKEEILPKTEKGENLELKDISRTKHTTQPPSRYNEASLVKKMKSEGVGRPSTYPSTMEGIQKRGYVERIDKKNSLKATDLGLRVYNYLQPNFKNFFMDVGFTALMENNLDEIEHGKKKFLEVIEEAYKILLEEIKKARESSPTKRELETTGEKCFVCKKGDIVERHGKFGNFYACDQYPSCKSVFEKNEEGKFIVKTKKASESKDTGELCPVCKKGKIVCRKGQYGDFYACNAYPKCKTVFEKNDDKFEIKKRKPYKGSSDKNYENNSSDSKDSDDIIENLEE